MTGRIGPRAPACQMIFGENALLMIGAISDTCCFTAFIAIPACVSLLFFFW